MPTRNKKLPKVVTVRKGQEHVVDLRPPNPLLGEPMPKPDSKGKILPDNNSEDLIVWDNRQVS